MLPRLEGAVSSAEQVPRVSLRKLTWGEEVDAVLLINCRKASMEGEKSASHESKHECTSSPHGIESGWSTSSGFCSQW